MSKHEVSIATCICIRCLIWTGPGCPVFALQFSYKMDRSVRMDLSRISEPRSPGGGLEKPRSSCLFVDPQNSPPGVESLMLMVLETCCPVGECNSPLQQALDQVGSDAGITESLSRLPYLPAADIPVGAGRSVGLRRQPKGQVLRHRVLEVLIHPCGKQRPGQSPMNLNGHGFEDWRPNRTDHDSWVDVLVRPPTLPEVVRAQMGIGRLQRFGYS